MRLKKLLVANRSEIAIRVMRAANEMAIRTVAIYANEDRFALHRFKADESYLVGAGQKPIAAYLDIADIVRIARLAKVDAVHPGYGFLSENPAFAEACEQAGVVFVGPPPSAMRAMGSKSAAKTLMEKSGVPLLPGYHGERQGAQFLADQANRIGYPLMIKAVRLASTLTAERPWDAPRSPRRGLSVTRAPARWSSSRTKKDSSSSR